MTYCTRHPRRPAIADIGADELPACLTCVATALARDVETVELYAEDDRPAVECLADAIATAAGDVANGRRATQHAELVKGA